MELIPSYTASVKDVERAGEGDSSAGNLIQHSWRGQNVAYLAVIRDTLALSGWIAPVGDKARIVF